MANKVYRIGRNGYKVAYEWDTGVQIIDPQELTNEYNTTREGRSILSGKYYDGEIPFIFGLQSQSKNYYYAVLRFKAKVSKYLFYNKKSNKSLFFDKTSEGIDLNIHYMADDYAIGYIDNTDTEGLQKVVSAEDAELLKNRKDDDNWWLVKFTFK